MHLTALVDHPDHVCCRYRLAAFRPFLERAGGSLDLVPLPGRWWGRLPLYRRLHGAAVVLQRRLLPAWELERLRRSARLLLFDLDDAVFLRDSYAPRGLRSARRLRRFAAAVRACDAVIAGNAFLAAHASRWAGPNCVHVIPTCVDPSLYPADRPKADSDGVQLVWVGSSSTLRGLEAIRPTLEEIGRRVPRARLKIICDRFLHFAALPVVERPWDAADETEEIAAADVGISWIPMTTGAAASAASRCCNTWRPGCRSWPTPSASTRRWCAHGETGFLADTAEEWVDAVGRLARDPELRRRMGAAGRRLLEERYSVGRGAWRWLDLLEGLRRGERRAG